MWKAMSQDVLGETCIVFFWGGGPGDRDVNKKISHIWQEKGNKSEKHSYDSVCY